jgi:hypothetical protein
MIAIVSFPSEAHIFCLNVTFAVSSLEVFPVGCPFLILADSSIIMWNVLAVGSSPSYPGEFNDSTLNWITIVILLNLPIPKINMTQIFDIISAI